MYIVMAQVGDGKGNKSFPICQIEVQDPRTGMTRLRILLATQGINAEQYLDNWLKWRDVLFSIRDVPIEDGLGQMLKAVRIFQEREDEENRQYLEFLHLDP